MAAVQFQELTHGYLGIHGLSAPFLVLHRQALFAAVGTAKKVIVAGAKLRAPAGVGAPVMRGRSSEPLSQAHCHSAARLRPAVAASRVTAKRAEIEVAFG